MRHTLYVRTLFVACSTLTVFSGIAAAQDDNPGGTLSSLLERLGDGAILRGLKLEFKSFDTKQGSTSAGIAYDYDRTFALFGPGQIARLGVTAKGNVAFDPDVNPSDFLESKINLNLRQDWGGVLVLNERTEEEKKEWARVRRQLAEIEDQEDLDEVFWTDPMVRKHAVASLSPQFVLDMELSGGLESNQDFTARQTTFGLNARAELNLWGNYANWNLFDYPFALIRYLADPGRDDGSPRWYVLGSTVPHVTIGLDLVSPEANDPRTIAGDNSDFLRLNVEVGFRTLLLHRASGDIFFNAHYRTYYELSPSEVVETANLDQFDYFRASITSKQGLFASYTTGRLPLGSRDADAYEVGWAFKF